jgi:hypothetical protein
MPFILRTEKAFFEYDQNTLFWQASYFGLVAVLVIYNLFIFFSTGDKSYLWYVAFMAGNGLALLSLNSISFQFLWPGAPVFDQFAGNIFLGLASAASAMFAVSFLDLKKLSMKYVYFFYAMACFALLGSALILFEMRGHALRVFAINGLVEHIGFIVFGIIAWRKGMTYASYYVVAWFCIGGDCAGRRCGRFVPLS